LPTTRVPASTACRRRTRRCAITLHRDHEQRDFMPCHRALRSRDRSLLARPTCSQRAWRRSRVARASASSLVTRPRRLRFRISWPDVARTGCCR
jgi:hypothetical protein